MTPRRLGALIVVLALAITAAGAFAQAPVPAPADTKPVETPAAPVDRIKELTAKVAEANVAVDTVWVLVAGFLVFFMALGFLDRADQDRVNVLHLGGNVRDVNKDRDRTEVIGTVGLAFTC